MNDDDMMLNGYDLEQARCKEGYLTMGCSKCHRVAADIGGIVVARTREQLEEEAGSLNWTCEDGVFTCPECRSHQRDMNMPVFSSKED